MAEQGLTPKEEIENAIQARVKELVVGGSPEKAAAIMTEYKRSLLPDAHPSKSPDIKGILMGENVSQMAAFDEEVRAVSEEMAFMSAITAGGMSPDMAIANMRILGKFLMWEQPHVLAAATQYLLGQKTAEGLIPVDNKEIENVAPETND